MSSDLPRRILILFADYGYGHRSASMALQAALEKRYGERVQAVMVNPIEEKSAPDFLRKEQERYDERVTQNPKMYKFAYDLSDMGINTALTENAMIVMLHEPISTILKKHRPDAILNTYPLFNAPLSGVYTTTKTHIPTITAVTDFTQVSRMWFHQDCDLTTVPTQTAQQLALERGLDPQKLRITGIPVHPAITGDSRSQADIRQEFGWQTNRTTLLVVGSKRVRNLPDVLHAVNHSGLPLQLVLVAGGDDDLFERYQAVEWHLPVHIYNRVDNIPTMMNAADVIACKAGGLITSEALASGLPILYIDAIQGQETGNVDYVTGEGAGEYAKSAMEALEILFHWLEADGHLLAERAANVRRIGFPNAAGDIAEIAWEFAGQGPQKVERTFFSLEHITDLLNNFQPPWTTEKPSG
jgi:1,2-diacylglycerol 3-beta-galactosyltransferase